MENMFKLLVSVLLIFFLQFATSESLSKGKYDTFIVQMSNKEMPTPYSSHQNWYYSCVKSVSDTADILYSYKTVFHGFAARVTEEEAEILRNKKGIVSISRQKNYELHTTRTPTFLGIDNYDISDFSISTTNIIVGVMDGGAWPESKSFDDEGMDPVPSSWKGECESSSDFSASSCNKKLIGARYFYKGIESALGPINVSTQSKSPRDDSGHGTHTSSTAAGSVVANASLFGYAPGAARGMAYRARVAVYKVCWKGGCFDADILAAMEKAVEDGVHVLSISLGSENVTDYYENSIAIGAFTAVQNGIFVSCSAGNFGPGPRTLSNFAPWITTVGAGTLDRQFHSHVSLGNGKMYDGISIYYREPLPDYMVELIYAGHAGNASDGNLCMPGTLIPEKVAGKIVFCEWGGFLEAYWKGVAVKQAGGIGMVLGVTALNAELLPAITHVLPASDVDAKSADAIKSYIFSDPNPTATIIFGETRLGVQPSPVVAAFSSRGPNVVTPEILKPDLIAPGVNVLAAWTGKVGPTGLESDPVRVEFNIQSGTSMACPHVSGAAVLLKAAHPDWSPAAIKSALMTTSYITYKSSGQPILDTATAEASTPFDHGAGHVDPIAALDPGLVYDLKREDYLDLLCALHYSPEQISKMTKSSNFFCDSITEYNVGDFNYPSFSVSAMYHIVKRKRTLTNVGSPGIYKASSAITTTGNVKDAVKILIEPDWLSFTQKYEKLSFTVTFITSRMPPGTTVFGRIEWSDGKHIVSSPVAVSWGQGRKDTNGVPRPHHLSSSLMFCCWFWFVIVVLV
ncbi:hypothetical protein MKW92_014205 [Papaver armeniacum]|nr:hypothetical protein MKW92_014205 [Papaver armeniacum]